LLAGLLAGLLLILLAGALIAILIGHGRSLMRWLSQPTFNLPSAVLFLMFRG
jgi:hypothetical protein